MLLCVCELLGVMQEEGNERPGNIDRLYRFADRRTQAFARGTGVH